MTAETPDDQSAREAAKVEINTRYGKVGEPDSSVKPTFTPKRRSKRPRRDVETLDYLGAARRFIAAAGRRVGECDEHELAALLALQKDLDQAIQTAVEGQREHGKSWAMIARGTGTTREAAYQRWGKGK